MREIKFRGRDANGKWWHGSLLQSSPHSDGIATCWIKEVDILGLGANSTPTSKFHEVDPNTVGQFTSIKDKNGVEIYEGDIVKLIYIHDEGGGWRSNSKEVGKVYFSSHWGVKFDCVDFTQRTADRHWKLEKSSFQDATDVLVIGNIHENPELFKATE